MSKKVKNNQKLFLYLIVLLLIVVLPFLAFKFLQGQSLFLTQKVKQNCPYPVYNIDKEYLEGENVDIIFPPIPITPGNVEVIDEPFDPYQAPAGESFFTMPLGSYPWTQAGSFDVDKDGLPEEVITANTAMNHTPHVVKILKNNRVIFEAQGISLDLKPVNSNDGFYLTTTEDWKINHTITTRYIYDQGKFIPVWQQTECQATTP